MITTKKLETLQDFQNLKKGDLVACEFHRDVHDYPKKSFRFKVFEIAEAKHRTSEIIVQKKNNLYFNYAMFIDSSDGASNLKSAILITCDSVLVA